MIEQKRTQPRILVFDSGVGGLSVYSAIQSLMPGARYLYAADDAGFPYGAWAEPQLIQRVSTVVGALIEAFKPDLAVIACNTASTIVLPALRQAFAIPFVGTVPAIKPAAQVTKSGRISVLATPGTVSRSYTQDLIRQFASHCQVTLVGARQLAGLAEAALRGEAVDDSAIAAEIAPCFVEDREGRTDVVTLSCTHYPLIIDRIARLCPWPVALVDPAPAIARRALALLPSAASALAGELGDDGMVVMTSGRVPQGEILAVFARYGLHPGSMSALKFAA
jgi:glutamate racemase